MKKQPVSRDQKAREKLNQITKKKIIIFGSSAHKSTGNSKLIYHMAKAFQSGGHEVFTIGSDYNAMQIWFDGIPIMPSFNCNSCGHAHKGDDGNVQKIADYINLLQPDFFICVGDPYQMQQFGMGNLSFEKIKTKSLIYATIDSIGMFCNERELANGHKDYLLNCDKVIATAKFTQQQLKSCLNMDSDLIYETIDLNNYFPIGEDKKQELRKKYRFKKDDFVIYNSGRNIVRKRLFTLLDGCIKFLCEHENAYLLLNCPKEGSLFPDPLNPEDFIKRIMKKKYGRDMLEEGKIIFVERTGLGSNKITEKDNAELYQISDVYATATSGEGFSLTPVESMACGVPAITPNNSTGPEILGATGLSSWTRSFVKRQGGLLVNAPIELYVDWGLKQYLTTSDHICNALVFLYEHPKIRNELRQSGRKLTEELFNFDTFKKEWLKIIETTEKREAPAEFETLDMKGEKEKGEGT